MQGKIWNKHRSPKTVHDVVEEVCQKYHLAHVVCEICAKCRTCDPCHYCAEVLSEGGAKRVPEKNYEARDHTLASAK